jgi:hypothetical protein
MGDGWLAEVYRRDQVAHADLCITNGREQLKPPGVSERLGESHGVSNLLLYSLSLKPRKPFLHSFQPFARFCLSYRHFLRPSHVDGGQAVHPHI